MAREMQTAVTTGRLLLLSAQPTDISGALNWTLPIIQEGSDVPTALLGVLVAQILALFSSVNLGHTPDNPFPGGSVNRVVQGVTIHSLS
jgi:tagatose-6-phosphate ketose/aldose isomerase